MKKELIVQLHTSFEQLSHREEESGVEFWLARDLQKALGYDRWENFEKAIERAVTACEKSGYKKQDHFLETTKMIPLGKGGEREVSDYMLTRYACYLIAQNGDPTKAPIAFAQTYFAIQTRKQELIEHRLFCLTRTIQFNPQIKEPDNGISFRSDQSRHSRNQSAIFPACHSAGVRVGQGSDRKALRLDYG